MLQSSIHEEFRDGGVSQARLANSKDSGITPGGGGPSCRSKLSSG